jgi:hypothetical protein
MHAFLITGGDDTDRQEALISLLTERDIPVYARLQLIPAEEGKTIGIGQVREWIRSLSASQPGVRKAGIVGAADTMTPEAQNALLKTLEEPPPSTTIVICSPVPEALLETVRSRCQAVRLKPSVPEDAVPPPSELTDPACSVGAWLAWVDREAATRDAAKRQIEGMLGWCRQTLAASGHTDETVPF